MRRIPSSYLPIYFWDGLIQKPFSKGIDNYYYEATSKASQIKRSFDKNSFAAYSIFCGQDG